MNYPIIVRLFVSTVLLIALGIPFTPVASAQSAVPVSLPNRSGDTGTRVTIPITVGTTTGRSIIAFEFTLTFNPNVLTVVSVRNANTLSQGWNLTTNTGVAGEVRVVAFNTTALSGSGTLLNLVFDVTGGAGSNTPLTFVPFTFNEGIPAAQITNGSFTVNGGVQPGNCNGDSAVDAGDLTALVLEIFDGDGTAVGAVGGGTFAGTAGCDANTDAAVDAGDISCTVLRIFDAGATCTSGSTLRQTGKQRAINTAHAARSRYNASCYRPSLPQDGEQLGSYISSHHLTTFPQQSQEEL